MNSEELKLVFGFEPSGLLEKVTLAPGIGFPRTSPSGTSEDESEVRLTGSGSFGVAGVSFFTIFGNCIFGSDGNCPDADWAKIDATAIVAISNKDNLHISISPFVG